MGWLRLHVQLAGKVCQLSHNTGVLQLCLINPHRAPSTIVLYLLGEPVDLAAKSGEGPSLRPVLVLVLLKQLQGSIQRDWSRGDRYFEVTVFEEDAGNHWVSSDLSLRQDQDQKHLQWLHCYRDHSHSHGFGGIPLGG